MLVASITRQLRHTRSQQSYLNPYSLATALALGAVALLMAFPFVWLVSASLKVPATAFKLPPELWPYEWRFENYLQVLANPAVPIPHFFLNSFKIAVLVTCGELVTCTLAAYAFARLRFPGREALFVLLLTSMMVPSQVTLIPTYILMSQLHLVNTHAALILPGLTSVFGIFLLRQFLLGIPDELEDAARIDGAGPVTMLWAVMVPLIGPALSTLGIITFNWYWNAFFGPLIFLHEQSKFTWTLGMAVLRGEWGAGSLTVQMAGISIGVIPVLIVFILGQRYIIQSVTFTGIKG
jgi:multiple sugar transport system permease protein